MKYQLFNDLNGNNIGAILSNDDGSAVGFLFSDNNYYQAYLKWLDEGNTPLPADEV